MSNGMDEDLLLGKGLIKTVYIRHIFLRHRLDGEQLVTQAEATR
jgi:hypothetical protein